MAEIFNSATQVERDWESCGRSIGRGVAAVIVASLFAWQGWIAIVVLVVVEGAFAIHFARRARRVTRTILRWRDSYQEEG